MYNATQQKTQEPTLTHSGKVKCNLVDVRWLAARLKVSFNQVYTMIREKRIPPVCVVKIGRTIRIKEEAVEAWIEAGGETPTSPGLA